MTKKPILSDCQVPNGYTSVMRMKCELTYQPQRILQSFIILLYKVYPNYSFLIKVSMYSKDSRYAASTPCEIKFWIGTKVIQDRPLVYNKTCSYTVVLMILHSPCSWILYNCIFPSEKRNYKLFHLFTGSSDFLNWLVYFFSFLLTCLHFESFWNFLELFWKVAGKFEFKFGIEISLG